MSVCAHSHHGVFNLDPLIPPPEAPVTAHEEERAAMIDRRRDFMATLMDQPLLEETLNAAKADNIFMGCVSVH